MNASSIGAEKKHLSLTVESCGKTIKAVGFFMGNLLPYLDSEIDIAFNLETNLWQGEESVQLILKDIKNSERR